MSSLRAECPSCDAKVKIANLSLAGKTVKCRKCGKPFKLPDLDDDSVVRDEKLRTAHKNRQTEEDDPGEPVKRAARQRRDEDDDEVVEDRPKARKNREPEEYDASESRQRASVRRGDDDDDERPRKKKRRSDHKTPTKKRLLLIFGAVGIVLLAAGIGAIVLRNGPSVSKSGIIQPGETALFEVGAGANYRKMRIVLTADQPIKVEVLRRPPGAYIQGSTDGLTSIAIKGPDKEISIELDVAESKVFVMRITGSNQRTNYTFKSYND
jgi:predicted Zn finger-like uncharacterized protein